MGIKQKFANIKEMVFRNPSFTVKEQLGYAGGIFGNAMGQDSVGTYSDKFSRDFLGIDNSLLTIKENITEIIGFVAPPIAGTILDRPTRVGKRSSTQKIIGSMPIPFAITSMLLFIVPSSNPFYNFIWTFFLSTTFSIVDTFYDLALTTLSLRMTSNPDDRKNFYTVSSLASTLGSMLPGWLIPMIVGTTDDATKQKWLYFFVALVFCIIGVSTMYTPFFTLQEKVGVIIQNENETKVRWNKDILRAILHNRPFIILEISSLLEMIRQITYKMLPYLYDNTFGDYKMKAIIDAISGALSYAGLFAVPFVGKKVSARNMMVGGYAYTSFFYALISLFNIGFNLKSVRKRRYIIGILIGLSGMPNSALGAARKIIVADSTDYMEWYSQKNYGTPMRSDGMLCAAKSIIDKAIALLKTNLYYALFGLIGYKEGGKDPVTGESIKVVQTNSTLRGIFAVASLCGLIGSLLPSICYIFDNYTGERRKNILAELAQMRAARAVATENAKVSDDESRQTNDIL